LVTRGSSRRKKILDILRPSKIPQEIALVHGVRASNVNFSIMPQRSRRVLTFSPPQNT